MSAKLAQLESSLRAVLGEAKCIADRGQLTIELAPASLLEGLGKLRDDPALAFSQLIDLAGIDYQEFGGNWNGPRFAVNFNLLSITHNWRVRVRTHPSDDDFPVLDTAIGVWPAANWYEREAFDLYGIVFAGHPDLRRILTDYGFVGHPFRKDFPISGHVEMRYDPEQGRVIYQPVTIEPREIVPRVIRESQYAGRK